MEFLYYPLVIRNGIESTDFPDALVTSAPRGSHRHREKDVIAFLLTLGGDHRYTAEEIQELLKKASNVFFASQGSVTRAMQAGIDQINNEILERNRDRGYEGIRAVGSINVVVLHNDWLFAAQYGSTLTILISSEQYDEFGILEGIAETLGQSKRVQVRFYQSGFKFGDLILMNGKAPTTWNSYYLAGSAKISVAQVKQRLLNQVTNDMEAIVIKCAEGSAQVITKNWNEPFEEELIQDVSVKTSFTTNAQAIEEKNKNDSLIGTASDKQKYEDVEEKTDSDSLSNQIKTDEVIYLGGGDVSVVAGETEKPRQSGNSLSSENIPENSGNPFLIQLARFWMNSRTFKAKVNLWVERIRKRILPNTQPSQGTSVSALSALMAVSIPLILIFISATIYSRIGKAEQFSNYMNQAQNFASLAKVEKDPLQKHSYWTETLDMVKAAEIYNVTQESRLLFEQAQFILDEMDLAARLDFRPALTQFFPTGVVINRIQSSSSGVYLLDKTSGSVMRIYLNSKGFFEIDDQFKCAPGPYGLETLTDLVDFVILPANADNYRIMALDSQGNLLYCRPGELAVSRKLTAPETGWGRIIGAASDNNTLYIMDADKDSIWMYAGKDPNKPNVETATGIVFSESPIKYFDQDVPDLGGALDLIVNQEDLYVLHADGHMTQCRYSADKKVRLTECLDPSPYTDNRVGRKDRKPWIFSDAVFSMAQATQLPNASIFLLNTSDQSIYQFSFQLNLERVLKAQYNKNFPIPSSSPSGFGITPEADLFLAFDNRLFIAPMQ